MGLKTVSFNCHGLKSSTVEIKYLCSNHDILFLQETWLFEQELTLLSNIHPEFEGCGVSGMDSENHLLTGRAVHLVELAYYGKSQSVNS